LCDKGVSDQCNVKAVRIMIKDGEVYLNSLHPNWRLGPHEFIGFLLELYETSKIYKLPDVEFAWNGDDDASSPTFDWKDRASSLAVTFHGGPFPLLAWSKSDKSMAQLVPYSGAFRCGDDSFDALLGHQEFIKQLAWDEKEKVAFGRWNEFCAPYYRIMPPLPSGERFPCPRVQLPKVSLQHLDLLVRGWLGRYLVSTDGWAISSKFDKYLLLGSTIIKAASSRFGFYYDALKPGEHYLSCLNASKDDIVDVVRWAQEHDEEAARIAANAQQFAEAHLHRGARLCYYRTLIEELGKRMRYTPSCEQRKLCLPLGTFLSFLSTYPFPQKKQVYPEVLSHYDNTSVPYADKFTADAIKSMLQDDKFWPWDTDIPPLDHQPYFPRRRRRAAAR
ncbi:KDEL motif-containing protein 1, partial [Tetrabaena socialis]